MKNYTSKKKEERIWQTKSKKMRIRAAMRPRTH